MRRCWRHAVVAVLVAVCLGLVAVLHVRVQQLQPHEVHGSAAAQVQLHAWEREVGRQRAALESFYATNGTAPRAAWGGAARAARRVANATAAAGRAASPATSGRAGPAAAAVAAAAAAAGASRVHVVFSTDCGAFMAWQAVALLDSAARVGQRGVFTRLVHGCDAAAEAALRAATACGRYPFPVHLHFTKDFNKDFHVSEGAADAASPKRFRFANKPRGVHHWLAHHGDAFRENHAHGDEDVAIALIDPDFVFLRPLDLWVLLGERRGDRWDDRASVLELRGRPRAHYNGLGGKWLDFHRSAICGEGSPCSTRRPAGNAKDTRRVP